MTPEEIKKIEKDNEMLRYRVAMLMNELRAIFVPEMKLTFIARNPDEPGMYTLLTEETDMENFAAFVLSMKKPETLDIKEPADVIN